MGLLPSTLFERHPSFFCFLFSRTWEVTVRSRWRDHQNNLDTNKIRTKFSNTFLFLNFEFNTYTSILTLGPKQTQPETLTLTITPTQGLTDTMSTFRLFLLDMVRQGGCHAVTLFLFWITFIVSKKCAQRISFFFHFFSSFLFPRRLTSGSSEGGPEGSDFEEKRDGRERRNPQGHGRHYACTNGRGWACYSGATVRD